MFERYAYHGTPDVRVIVFNRVPVMAMLRLPTKESGGRANLFQGAVGAGIDMASGVTTYAIQHSKEIVFMPGTRRKVRAIQIPEWERVLEFADHYDNMHNDTRGLTSEYDLGVNLVVRGLRELAFESCPLMKEKGGE